MTLIISQTIQFFCKTYFPTIFKTTCYEKIAVKRNFDIGWIRTAQEQLKVPFLLDIILFIV